MNCIKFPEIDSALLRIRYSLRDYIFRIFFDKLKKIAE